MKIILSRKGFDSGNGGQPSPILPDGTLLSLPIPYKNGIQFSKPTYQNMTYFDIIKQLNTKTQITENNYCHLDPDIRFDAKERDSKWKGLFGQSRSARQHLINQGVEEGDVFLFFGWFRQTELIEKKLRYKRGAPDLHVIYGYLQIGSIFEQKTDLFPNIEYHPHANFDEDNDCIYQASDFLEYYNDKPGYGTFKFNERLVLTKKGMSRSKWELPDYFRDIEISYHTKLSFVNDYFQSARIGQEFVIECNKPIHNWAKNILSN